jgi:FkbM family methyltransferase
LPRFLPKINKKSKINIVIAGAYTGDEIHRIIKNVGQDKIKAILFEANPVTAKICKDISRHNPNINVINKALSDCIGSATFHENSIQGTGSLLPLAVSAISQNSINEIKSFDVEVTTLDYELPQLFHSSDEIDMLWIDVQGAELQVLKGGENLLSRVNCVFIEVQHGQNDYIGGSSFDKIDSFLKSHSFRLFLLGMNPGHNQGNAFYIAESSMVWGQLKA